MTNEEFYTSMDPRLRGPNGWYAVTYWWVGKTLHKRGRWVAV